LIEGFLDRVIFAHSDGCFFVGKGNFVSLHDARCAEDAVAGD
jgi:hypothetical protein